jgi:hypothetical protein
MISADSGRMKLIVRCAIKQIEVCFQASVFIANPLPQPTLTLYFFCNRWFLCFPARGTPYALSFLALWRGSNDSRQEKAAPIRRKPTSIHRRGVNIVKKPIFLTVIALLFVFSLAYANQKVRLTGYVVDVKCAAEHAKGKPEEVMKFAAEHTKACALMEECVRSGYGIFADGHWFPFDAKGNELAKTLFEKTQKKDHIKATVEGTKHEGKIFVQKLTEVN